MDDELREHATNAAKEAVSQANSYEESVAKQIILISSGALALIGSFLIASPSRTAETHLQVLLTITILSIVIALVTSLIQLLINHAFSSRRGNIISEAMEQAGQHKDKDKQIEIFNNKVKAIPTQNSSVPFWFSIVSFAVSSLLIVTIILILIWS